MQQLKSGFFLILGLVFFLGSVYLFLQQPATEKFQGSPILEVNGEVINIEIADDNVERVQGLSKRTSLPVGTGLLFAFESSTVQTFWMKDMLFAIDIVWIDESWEVIGVAPNAKPESFPNTFSSPGPAQYVLELNAGEADKFGLAPGVKVTFRYQN